MTSTIPFNNDLSTWSQELYLFLSSVWTKIVLYKLFDISMHCVNRLLKLIFSAYRLNALNMYKFTFT